MLFAFYFLFTYVTLITTQFIYWLQRLTYFVDAMQEICFCTLYCIVALAPVVNNMMQDWPDCSTEGGRHFLQMVALLYRSWCTVGGDWCQAANHKLIIGISKLSVGHPSALAVFCIISNHLSERIDYRMELQLKFSPFSFSLKIFDGWEWCYLYEDWSTRRITKSRYFVASCDKTWFKQHGI